ncbi:hypothetical protein C8R45DRAFT_1211230 [Mycena sanguinolenta]|nr:hypothetical protein C8R45DRAFT_1211230 [Mycena sanguinolenta]
MPKVVVLDDDAFSHLQEVFQSVPAGLGRREANILSSLQTSFAAAVPVPAASLSHGSASVLPNSTTMNTHTPGRVTLPQTRLNATPTIAPAHSVSARHVEATVPRFSPSRFDSSCLSRLERSLSLPPLEELAFAHIPDREHWTPIVLPPLIHTSAQPVPSPLFLSPIHSLCTLSPLTSPTLSSIGSPTLSPSSSPLHLSATLHNSHDYLLADTEFNSNGKRLLPEHEQAPPGKLTIRVPGRSQGKTRNGEAAAAGPEGGVGVGGGPRKAKKKCKKRGDVSHAVGHRDVGVVDCGDTQCPRCGDADEGTERVRYMDVDGETEVGDDEWLPEPEPQQGKKKKGKKQKATPKYTTKGKGPALDKDAGTLLGEMVASIFSPSKRAELDEFLDSLGPVIGSIDRIELQDKRTNLESTLCLLKKLEKNKKITSFWEMLALVQLVIHVETMREDADKKHDSKPGIELIGIQCGYSPSTFYRRVQDGTRLLSLCAASSPYILPIIAVTNMLPDLRNKNKSSTHTIQRLCEALRLIEHDQWGALVKRLRIPLHYISQRAPFLSTIDFVYNVPLPLGQEPRVEYVSFHGDTDNFFNRIPTNFPRLPPRSPDWQTPIPPWNIFIDPKDLVLPTVRHIKMPEDFVKSSCPVTENDNAEFTVRERKIAASADMAKDLDHFQRMINDPKRKPYIGTDTSILNGEILHITDKSGKFIADIFTLPPDIQQTLEDAIGLVQTAMPGQWYKDCSDRSDYRFFNCHWSFYTRNGERGHNAPKDAPHINNVQRQGSKVNFTQRIPYESKDIREKPREWAILADAFAAVFDYIRITLQRRFPDQYENLRIYCDALPMHTASPAYPFGGFVLNLHVATWAHQDHGDKDLCIVIPFGNFKGGELCLYEVGFKFDLRMGDILIFPSCDITHFNMDFSGKRGTLVLHSDRQGDNWVKEACGWSSYMTGYVSDVVLNSNP